MVLPVLAVISAALLTTCSEMIHIQKPPKHTHEEVEEAMLGFYAANAELSRSLLAAYSSRLAPIYMVPKNASDVRVPSFRIFINLINAKLGDIIESREIFLITLDLEVRWHDLRLRWDPANHSMIHELVLPEFQIWTPDFVFYDQAAVAENLIPRDARYVRVRHTGEVIQPIMHLVSTTCPLDMSSFPFDTQTCMVALGTFVYAASEISYQINIPEFEIDERNDETYGWHGNSEWEVKRPQARKVKTNNSLVKYEYVEIRFTFSRHASFFMSIIIWPTFLLNVLCIFGMFVDKTGDCLNKMILGLTTLMAMAVELEIIAEEMPKTQNMPLLAGFMFSSINIIALASIVILFLPTMKRARKSIPHLHTRRIVQPHILLLVLFESLNVLNFARLIYHKNRALPEPVQLE